MTQFALIFGPFCDQRHQLIAINQPTLFVDQQNAVCITIQRNAHISPMMQHRLLAGCWCRRSASGIDVQAIRAGADLNDLSP